MAGSDPALMRFAAVSDIHGNMPALEAVAADIRAQGVDVVVNLGDCLSGPLWPVETAEWLMARGWPTLAGNHERQMLHRDIAAMGITDAATARKLTPAIREWLSELPATIQLLPGVLLCHGTPQHDNRYWLHRGRRGAMREATCSEVAAEAADVELALCGHTHLARQVVLDDGRLIANPGSVGLPAYEDGLPAYHDAEHDEPHARYLIAVPGSQGWTVELRAVRYDIERAARQAERAGRPSWAEALRTGQVR